MASAYAVLTLLFTLFEVVAAQQHDGTGGVVSPGASLSPSKQPHSWNSSSGVFQFGFYNKGAGFAVGIWLVTPPDNTVVWTANGDDDPPLSTNATLTLTVDGHLILSTGGSNTELIADTQGQPASSASMLDSGNFVLHNNRSDIIWSSFKFPTDTILGGQTLYPGMNLHFRVNETDSRNGQFCLTMQRDGNLVLYTTCTPYDPRGAYWATGTDGPVEHQLFLNITGELQLLDKNMSVVKNLYPDSSLVDDSSSAIVDDSSSAIYLATLGHDGILRLYSYYFNVSGFYNKSVIWKKPDDTCDVKNICGLNGYCTLNDEQPICRCLPGTDFVDPNQQYLGCQRNFTEERCEGMHTSAYLYNMTSMEKMTWVDYPYFKADLNPEECQRSCLEDCNCDAVLQNSDSCTKHKLPIKYATRDQDLSSQSIAYFKTGKRNITIEDNDDTDHSPDESSLRSKKAIILILVMTVGFILCLCVFLGISGFFIFKHRVVKYKRLLETGSFGSNDELTLRSFSYNELKKATNGFTDELGKGSFGAVYKGTLFKGGKPVAVKRLEKMVNDGEREFRAEMHAIGRTHHKNLVRLLGYCAEDSKRLLVYEYMSNGSLADVLFQGAERTPEWKERVRIALDVARGLLYLHDECEAPIIHCDIKPQNILMDEFWAAKISDFGLAKLLMPDQTRTFTVVRGTRGYMAPEWYKNTPIISVKADVYSYGVVLLEIVCRRRNMRFDASKPEEIVLTNWVYKCFIDRELNKLVRGEEVEMTTLENMIKVGLWCVQDEPALRPSMKSVVMMLEGITEISIPPCPAAS